ncbi:MAG: acetyl/propionyl/methylcrotonyl-CoA carboxylase subunit alpha [Alphaproteobacteria bacterium]|nr:acetyl/propionyl/methylcrotonyl-CoA carboxylase subunit alpha [Alphaproteobacteria bacterium]
MFEKLLIANRGEIALRIMKTARKMGIRTVAVYSEADTNALHVQEADEAVYLGPSPSLQSYINIERLMAAIRASGADAVHPGYGFLSENADFAKAVEKERRVTFIGPSSKAVMLMGDKLESKRIAREAGVNTVPGGQDAVSSFEDARELVKKIGYPVMIKAAAGGGGKGMRVVNNDDELKEGLRGAAAEAGHSFSDDRVFIEKFVTKPRHIEIQILGDKKGNVVFLGERECSIQRRHQKIIEEAPSPFLDEKTRKAMGEQAVALAKKVGYHSAGTVEFIVDGSDGNFYFLEMNTRLQVEHRVTEQVTKIDLVEQMIRIAAGEKLPFTQDEVKIQGWSMETRVYAEDPSRGFLPSTGRITRYKEPEIALHKVIVDSGIYEGGEVSMFYDPMVAKVVTHGANRKEAIEAMQAALGAYVIRGISHNISFLEAILGHKRFQEGDMSTLFIAEEYPEGFAGAELTSETAQVFLGTAVHMFLRDAERAAKGTGQLPGRERAIGARWVVAMGEQQYSVFVRPKEYGYDISYQNVVISVRSSWNLGKRLFQGTINGRQVSVKVDFLANGYRLTHGGSTVEAKVLTPRVAELFKYMPEDKDGGKQPHLKAPIAGMVVALKVEEGQEIKRGQELVLIEAMKMENVIYADHDAIVKKISVSPGDSVAVDQTIIEFDRAA